MRLEIKHTLWMMEWIISYIWQCHHNRLISFKAKLQQQDIVFHLLFLCKMTYKNKWYNQFIFLQHLKILFWITWHSKHYDKKTNFTKINIIRKCIFRESIRKLAFKKMNYKSRYNSYIRETQQTYNLRYAALWSALIGPLVLVAGAARDRGLRLLEIREPARSTGPGPMGSFLLGPFDVP